MENLLRINAHPHYSDDKMVVTIHNGIIENYQELKEKLLRNGYTFYSETDTEVVTKLIDYYYEKTHHNPLDSIASVMLRVRGSYALGIMFQDRPGVIYAARKDSPLILGQSDKGTFIASDVPAILAYTRSVYYIGNMEMAELTRDEITFYNIDREKIEKEKVEINWDAQAAEKGGYEHFMMKEIHEQPKAVRDTVNAYVKEDGINLSEVGIGDEFFRGLKRVYLIACGSAYHVGMAAKYVIEDLTDLPVEIDLASEFRYRNPKLEKESVVIIISQSGETADSLAALRLTKERGIPTLGIINVLGSSIARESRLCAVHICRSGDRGSDNKGLQYTADCNCYLLAIAAANVRGLIRQKTVCVELLAGTAAVCLKRFRRALG